uniref:Uncharacterized protein n=1 Tax=Kwoniella dejecticola CBS 10117 TaxID=1296121 RepID=A0A1A6A151_9TREE|nr:uncharacterized protein I303_06067 [Kwoniella dejecticola CBS 10117]OBR83785.1 hypothetical protein I303_06067 [Kwoniella dejecticola CBS 10117]
MSNISTRSRLTAERDYMQGGNPPDAGDIKRLLKRDRNGDSFSSGCALELSAEGNTYTSAWMSNGNAAATIVDELNEGLSDHSTVDAFFYNGNPDTVSDSDRDQTYYD